MIMFGITTFMFVLGIIALVLETTLGFLKAQSIFDPNHAEDLPYRIYYYTWATITCLMVPFLDALMPFS